MADVHDEAVIDQLFPDDLPDGTYLVVEAEGNVFLVWRDDEHAKGYRPDPNGGPWFTEDELAKSLGHLLRMADRVWVLGEPTVSLPGANPRDQYSPAVARMSSGG